MADRLDGSNAHQGTRSRLASFLLVLLPGFMFLGLLAPAAVTIQFEGEEETLLPATLRDFQLPLRRPMIATHAATKAGATEGEFAALRELLASGTRLLAQGARDALRLPKLQSGDDANDIVLGDRKPGEDELVNELFGSSAAGEQEGELVADLDPLFGKRFAQLRGPLDPRGDRMDDDFPGDGLVVGSPVAQAVPIPEPQSAVLIALGLASIALRRRRG